MRRRIDPGLVLLLTPMMWGATFPAAKLALAHLPPFTFMAWTRALGFVAIAVMVPWLARRAARSAGDLRRVLGPALILGALIFVAYILQTEGLARTTATNAAFITCLYVVFTPILASVTLRQRITPAAWIAVVISMGGMALLSIQRFEGLRIHPGDFLVLAGAVCWAGHVTGIAHYSPKFPAWLLSLGQMAATAALQLIATIPVGLRLGEAASSSVWPLLFITGALGSGVAYTIQILGQQQLTAARAVVILAGESIFAALFAAVWIGERLHPHQWLGAALVLAAMVYSEMGARRPRAALLEPASAE